MLRALRLRKRLYQTIEPIQPGVKEPTESWVMRLDRCGPNPLLCGRCLLLDLPIDLVEQGAEDLEVVDEIGRELAELGKDVAFSPPHQWQLVDLLLQPDDPPLFQQPAEIEDIGEGNHAPCAGPRGRIVPPAQRVDRMPLIGSFTQIQDLAVRFDCRSIDVHPRFGGIVVPLDEEGTAGRPDDLGRALATSEREVADDAVLGHAPRISTESLPA